MLEARQLALCRAGSRYSRPSPRAKIAARQLQGMRAVASDRLLAPQVWCWDDRSLVASFFRRRRCEAPRNAWREHGVRPTLPKCLSPLVHGNLCYRPLALACQLLLRSAEQSDGGLPTQQQSSDASGARLSHPHSQLRALAIRLAQRRGVASTAARLAHGWSST